MYIDEVAGAGSGFNVGVATGFDTGITAGAVVGSCARGVTFPVTGSGAGVVGRARGETVGCTVVFSRGFGPTHPAARRTKMMSIHGRSWIFFISIISLEFLYEETDFGRGTVLVHCRDFFK